mgnify:CR=1 FL=1
MSRLKRRSPSVFRARRPLFCRRRRSMSILAFGNIPFFRLPSGSALRIRNWPMLRALRPRLA